MGLLTAKLTDEEHERLRGLAEARGISMAALIKEWIAAAGVTQPPTVVNLPTNPSPADVEKVRKLLAPVNDDCASCHHDRHYYHLEGVCTFTLESRRKCGCPVFVTNVSAMLEPF